MDLHHVRAFVAVAETGSVTKAAARLSYSQPGVSQQVRALERFLGSALFCRESGRLVLSAHGKTVLPYARMVLVIADQMLPVTNADSRTSA